jgi:hypothetical protein
MAFIGRALNAVSLKPISVRLVVRAGGILGMTVAHYRINELDTADRVVDGYSVMCRSDAAAPAMASKGAEDHAAAVEVWESTRRVARLDPVSPWHRLRRQWIDCSGEEPDLATSA